MKYKNVIVVEGNLTDSIKFLAEALSKDETRPFMHYIHIEQSEKEGELLGIATDGKRLHLVDPINIIDLKEGFWEVFKRGKQHLLLQLDDEGFIFPNWRKVLPTDQVEYKTTFTGYSSKRSGTNYPQLSKFIHDFPDITVINFKYLESLGTNMSWEVEWRGATKGIKFTADNRTAIIMPMQGAS